MPVSNRRTRLRATLLATLATPALLTAQRTWTVDGNGTGNFTAIQPAVQAASPGDRILVLPGAYPAFQTSKGLDIEAPVRATVAGVTVVNLGAGEQVQLSGFDVSGVAVSAPVFVIADCQGAVLVTRCSVGVAWFNPPGPVARIERSVRVSLHHCQLWGIAGTPVTSPGEGLSINQSSVALRDCFIDGGRGVDAGLQWGPQAGAHAVTVASSNLLVAECTLTGGAGGSGYGGLTCRNGAPGGAAVLVSGSSHCLFRHASSLSGGAGGPALAPCAQGSQGDAASDASLASLMTLDCRVNGALAGVTRIADLTGLDAPSEVSRGNLLVVSLPGPAGTLVQVIVGHQTDYLTVPGLVTPLLLGPWLVAIGVASIGSAGPGQLSLPVPADPALRDASLLFQGIAIPPTGPLTLTDASDVRIR